MRLTSESAPQAATYVKTRAIVNDEIVETLKAGDRALATIHRPTRGWYLAVRTSESDRFVSIVPSRGRQAIGHFSFAIETEAPTQDGKASDVSKRMYAILPSTPIKSRWTSLTGLFSDNNGSFSILDPDSPSPLLRFEDSTSVLSTASTGTLVVDSALVQRSGQALELFVAIALAVLESHEAAEAYRAAQDDLVD